MDQHGNEETQENIQVVTLTPLNRRRNILYGLAIVVIIALSWVGSTQLAQSTYSPGFNAPYFTTWFSTCWVMALFPLYSLPYCLVTGKNLAALVRESGTILGDQGLSTLSIIKYILPFCILWMGTNYLYIHALGTINAADVTAIFSSCSAFVYIFSWIWLHERIAIFKVSAVLFSIGGIILMAYSAGFTGPNAVGVSLSIGSAIGAALYKVLFKKVVGDATAPQVALFLSILGLLSTLLLWPIILILYYTHAEHIDWHEVPWKYLCGTSSSNLVFNFAINFGIAFTYPLFISLGIVLGIPINAVADALFRSEGFGVLKIIAAILIIVGFTLMLIPEEYEDKLQRLFGCRDTNARREGEEDPLITNYYCSKTMKGAQGKWHKI